MTKYKYTRKQIAEIINNYRWDMNISQVSKDIKNILLAKEQGEFTYECSLCGKEHKESERPCVSKKEQGECKQCHNKTKGCHFEGCTELDTSPLKEDIKEIEKLTNDDFDGSSDHDAINFLWEWNIEMQKKINQLIDAINHLSSKEK